MYTCFTYFISHSATNKLLVVKSEVIFNILITSYLYYLTLWTFLWFRESNSPSLVVRLLQLPICWKVAPSRLQSYSFMLMDHSKVYLLTLGKFCSWVPNNKLMLDVQCHLHTLSSVSLSPFYFYLLFAKALSFLSRKGMSR